MEDVRQSIEDLERQKKLPDIIEKRASKNSEKAKRGFKKIKVWKNRVPFPELQKRYSQETYAANLVHCKRLDEFDAKRNVCSPKCTHGCQSHFAANFDVIKTELQEWWGAKSSYAHQRTLLGQDILTKCIKKDDGTYEQRYFIADKQVCRNFYMRARGVHNGTLFAMEKDVLSKQTSILGEAFAKKKPKDKAVAQKKNEILAWLLLFAKYVGDKPPNESITVLPYRQIKPIWEEYVDDINSADGLFGAPATYTHFCDVFNKITIKKNIRLLRNTGSFVTCTICTGYHSRLRKVTSEQERKQLKFYRRAHLDKQRLQREKYYKNRRKATAFSKEFISIIMDGMDQKRKHLPVLNRQTKDKPALQQRLVGVKVHGKRNYAFLVDSTVPGGGNLMIHILREVLIDLDSRNELPNQNPTMFLQVDNCGENKNKVLFAFLVDLVRQNIFAKIKVGFLMTGHTHEDIDAFFSTIAAKMRSGVVCADLESFCAAVESAFQENDKPCILFINAVDIFDYKALYTPLIDKKISYHQEPHQFRIKRFDVDTVLLHYKQWCQSKHWLPLAPEKIKVPSNAEHINLDDDTEPQSATTSPEKKKPRRMTRWTTTSGQLSCKARLALSLDNSTPPSSDQDHCDFSINDNSENLDKACSSDR